jgi:hypothetical protein
MQFCQPCIWNWLDNGNTCPLCRVRLSSVRTLQEGYIPLRHINEAGEEVGPEEDEEDDEEDDAEEEDEEDESESEEHDENPPAGSTVPIHGIVRPRSESVQSERPSRRPRLEDDAPWQPLGPEPLPPTRMADDITHPETPLTTGDVGRVMDQQFIAYEPLVDDQSPSQHHSVTPLISDPSQPQLPELPSFEPSNNNLDL